MGVVDSLSYLSDEFPNSSQGPSNHDRRRQEHKREAQYRLNELCSAPELTASPLLPQKATAATAESIRRAAALARPPLLVQAAPAATARPQSGRVPRARTRQRRARQREETPTLPNDPVHVVPTESFKSAKNVTMHMLPRGCICV